MVINEIDDETKDLVIKFLKNGKIAQDISVFLDADLEIIKTIESSILD